MNSIEILDHIRTRAGIDSDRKVAKAIGMDQARISAIRTGRRKIDGPMAIKFAELAGVPAAYILALVAAERAEDERVALEWRRAAKLLKRGAAAVILATTLALSAPHPAEAAPVRVASDQSIHYAQWRRRGALGPDPRADRTGTAGRGDRRRRRPRRPRTPPALTVIAGGRADGRRELRLGADRRLAARASRDRRHGSGIR